MGAAGETYTSIHSDPFDGTTMPILFIPDWSKTKYQNKTTTFNEIPISDYIPLPQYDSAELSDLYDTSRAALIQHYTYITPYMGSYRLNYKEYDGSHNAIDIRAPVGTPVLSIANGVVVRTVEADATGNKFVVVRHEHVPLNGKITTLYSWYLHLSEISVPEWTKVRKGDMIGRVGMTGITTTPHLHFQIDTIDAPFHPYWPFTSADSRAAGLSIFESINAGLWKENGIRYSIHPIEFVYAHLMGVDPNIVLSSAPATPMNTPEPQAINTPLEQLVAQYNPSKTSVPESSVKTTITKQTVSASTISCTKKRFSDMDGVSKVGKSLYRLVDEKCMFQDISSFNPSGTITLREAITMIMDFYDINPSNGTSHFLDIPIGDMFQWYALVAYRRGVLDGNYANPDKLLSKEEFVELIVRLGKIEKNPSQIKLFNDVNAMNVRFDAIQSYALKAWVRWGNFAPQSILTRQKAVELLWNLYK